MSYVSAGRAIVEELPEHENVILAVFGNGNGNGVGLGANAGRLVKGLVLGKDKLDVPKRTFLEYCSDIRFGQTQGDDRDTHKLLTSILESQP